MIAPPLSGGFAGISPGWTARVSPFPVDTVSHPPASDPAGGCGVNPGILLPGASAGRRCKRCKGQPHKMLREVTRTPDLICVREKLVGGPLFPPPTYGGN